MFSKIKKIIRFIGESDKIELMLVGLWVSLVLVLGVWPAVKTPVMNFVDFVCGGF